MLNYQRVYVIFLVYIAMAIDELPVVRTAQ